MRGLAPAVIFFWLANFGYGQQPNPQNWLIGTSQTHGQTDTATFVDAARIQILEPPIRRAWSQNIFSPSATEASRGSSRFVAYQEYDCAERRFRPLQITIFFVDDRAPLTIPAPRDWQYGLPGSTGEKLVDFVCASPEVRSQNSKYKLLPQTTSPQEFAPVAISNGY